MKTTPIFQVKFPLNEEEGTDELSCLVKYLISHLAWQVKIDSLSSHINIYEKWHNVSFGKKIWGEILHPAMPAQTFWMATCWCRWAP